MLRQPHPGWERSEGILITKESHTILKLRSTPVMQSGSSRVISTEDSRQQTLIESDRVRPLTQCKVCCHDITHQSDSSL